MLLDLLIDDMVVSDNTMKHINSNYDKWEMLDSAFTKALISGSNRISPIYLVEKLGYQFMLEASYILRVYKLTENQIGTKHAVMEINIATVSKYLDISEFRHIAKMNKFIMRNISKIQPANLVKTHRGIEQTGLVRDGFAQSANHSFKLDVVALSANRQLVIDEVLNGVNKAIVEAKKNKSTTYDRYFSDNYNYSRIAEEIVDYYIANPDKEYNLEQALLDSRGRAIYKALKRIGNPVSYKVFRALLVIPSRTITLGINIEAINAIYRFIAEETGSKCLGKTESTKVRAGFRAYNLRILPNNLHTKIWLERIYNQLDTLYTTGTVKWNIPIEIDATASIAQCIGVLTGDSKLLRVTNVVGDTIQDPWTVSGLIRDAVKAVVTPTLYGSNASVRELFKAKKLDEKETTKEKRYLAGKLMSEGTFATAKLFKELFTKTYTPVDSSSDVVRIKIMEENFYVPVNKFKPIGTDYLVISLSTDKGQKRYMHQSVKYVVDHDRFKLFFASALIHNRDSYILNKTILDTNAWNIAIHDALVVHPLEVASFRNNYAKHLYNMYENREQILTDYRKSIGAVGRKASVLYTRMIQSIKPVKETEFNAMALK